MLVLEGGRVNKNGRLFFFFPGMDTFLCMMLHAEEVRLDRKSFLVGGINWEEVIRKAAHGGNTTVSMGKVEERCTGAFLTSGTMGMVRGTWVQAENG